MGKHKTKEKIKLDEFHYHEALDRTSMVNEIINCTLVHHPVFETHKKLKKKIEKAQSILYQVYQDVAMIDTDIPDTK